MSAVNLSELTGGFVCGGSIPYKKPALLGTFAKQLNNAYVKELYV